MEEAVMTETAGITGMEKMADMTRMADMTEMAIMTIIKGTKNEVIKYYNNLCRMTSA